MYPTDVWGVCTRVRVRSHTRNGQAALHGPCMHLRDMDAMDVVQGGSCFCRAASVQKCMPQQTSVWEVKNTHKVANKCATTAANRLRIVCGASNDCCTGPCSHNALAQVYISSKSALHLYTQADPQAMYSQGQHLICQAGAQHRMHPFRLTTIHRYTQSLQNNHKVCANAKM